MERLTIALLFLALLLAPALSHAAEAKAFKHLLSVYGDEKDAGFKSPEGVACNDKLDFLVADTGNGRLVRYSIQEGKLMGGREIQVPQLPYPLRLELNSKGEIYALDGKLRRIVKLTAAGAFAGDLSPRGVPAPEKVVPRSLKIDQADNLYLLDLYGLRVLVLDPAGNFQRQIPFPKGEGYFSDLAVAQSGEIFLLDPAKNALFVAAKGADAFAPLVRDLSSYATFPDALTTDRRGLLYMVDSHGGGIVSLGLDGSFQGRKLMMGYKDGQLNYPGQVCLAAEGKFIFVTDRENNKLQIFEVVR